MTAPYFDDGAVQLYHGDMREIIPELGLTADLIIADPPYGETSLSWDRWVDEWLDIAATVSRSMWCFGSMRMFLAWRDYFSGPGWKLSQDVIWEKHNGSGFAMDRFRRVHETAAHWYLDGWARVYRQVPRVAAIYDSKGRTLSGREARPPHTGKIGSATYHDDGLRLARSVLYVKSMQRAAIHPTEKPIDLLIPLIEYACAPDGLVLDPFAGSGSTLEAARLTGRRAIGIEISEQYAEAAARRLAQQTIGAAS